MQAAILEAYGKPLRITEVERPRPGPGQVLVRLHACGICHSDVHVWRGEVRPPTAPAPFILGHEGVGTIVEIGADVGPGAGRLAGAHAGTGAAGWKVGDAVGVPWLHDTCLQCSECEDGQESFCQHQRAHGLNVPGAFAEYVVADARFAVPLGAQVDPVATAPVMCAGVTAYGAIRRAAVGEGDTVSIFGCGGLGLYAVQIAARLGARVIAVDRDPAKLALATRYGAAATELADSGLMQRMAQADRKSHACINFAPTPATWKSMVAAIRPRGRIVAAALVSEPVELNQEWLTGTGVVITGTSVGTRREMDEVVVMHAERPLQNEITPIRLREVTEALDALAAGQAPGRYVIRF